MSAMFTDATDATETPIPDFGPVDAACARIESCQAELARLTAAYDRQVTRCDAASDLHDAAEKAHRDQALADALADTETADPGDARLAKYNWMTALAVRDDLAAMVTDAEAAVDAAEKAYKASLLVPALALASILRPRLIDLATAYASAMVDYFAVVDASHTPDRDIPATLREIFTDHRIAHEVMARSAHLGAEFPASETQLRKLAARG